MPRWVIIVRWIFTLAALVAAPVAIYFTSQAVFFVLRAEETTGRIDSVEYRDPTGSAARYYRPTFTFSVDGKRFTVTPIPFTGECPGFVGDPVPVLYDPRNPANASLNTFGYVWLPTAVSLPFGFVLPFGCYVLWTADPKYLIDKEQNGEPPDAAERRSRAF